jgi:hypothetical protein
VAHEAAPARGEEIARHPIPSCCWRAGDGPPQGKGLGAALLATPCGAPAGGTSPESVPSLCMPDDKLGDFYQHFDFDPSPKDPCMSILIKEIRRQIADAP